MTSFRRILSSLLFLAFAAQMLAQGAHPAPSPPRPGAKSVTCTGREIPQLEDVTEKAGVRFRHIAALENKYIVESMSGGVILIDYDRDGWLDIYFTNAPTFDMTRKNQSVRGALYHNNHDGTFKDVIAWLLIIGYIAIEPMLFGEYFKGVIFINHEAHPVMEELTHEFHGAVAMGIHAFTSAPFWLALAGVALSWFFYMKRPDIPAAIKARFSGIYTLLDNKYYFDKFNETFFAGGARALGRTLWKVGDVAIIDGLFVNGSARLVGWIAAVVRFFQSGYIYHYAFTMIIGVFVLLTLWFNRA